MENRNVLSVLRFIFFTIVVLALVFISVLITVLNAYKSSVKVFLGDKFIGYFSSEQQFDEIYNDLVTEKQNIDSNVKVYLEEEPRFEKSYTRENLFLGQNVYSNLRAEVKTEYTTYNVAVNGEDKMTFTTQDEAQKYADTLKKKANNLNVGVVTEKVNEIENLTTNERADTILSEIVDRNRPVNAISANSSENEFMQGGVWPTPATYVSSYYGWRWGTIHSGTDIAGKAKDPIYAYKSGVVTFAGWQTSYGNIVKIDHGNGRSTWYAHCSKLLVTAGQEVDEGQKISLMGSTGYSTGNHLHFEVRINGVHVNSYPYIQGKSLPQN